MKWGAIMLSMLSDLTLNDRIQYGTKASALGELMNNGEKVPDGFALSSEFFMKFLEDNNFPYTVEDYLSYNSEIRSFILNGLFSSDMETNLSKFFNSISHGKYAVRSSALCEDSDAYSMAGMFSSYTNLSSFEKVKNSIKMCYASLFSDKVIAYFAKHNLNFDDLKMCAIVQQFVEGDYSGVNFSADTIDMDENVMHVNAVSGLCENYVSGKAISAFYKLNKRTGEILEKRIPEDFYPISDDTLYRLYESTLRIEKIFSNHQDIEWTIKDNTIYILQARPITTFKSKNIDIKWQKNDDASFTWYRESDEPYEPLVNELSLIQGEALNKGFYAAGFQDFYSEYCVQDGYFYYRNKEMTDRKQQEEKFKALIKKLHDEYKNIFQDIILPKLLPLKKDLDDYMSRELSPKEALSFLEKSKDYMNFLASNHQPVTHGCDYLDNFMEYCRKINCNLSVEDFYDLVFNISILNRERELYFHMAKEINENSVLNKMFKECQYDELLYCRLKRISESKDLLKTMEDYISIFGICNLDSYAESPYPEPLLMEDPSRVIGCIRGFLGLNAEDFKTSIENSLKNKKRIKSMMLNNLDERERQEFLYKLDLAEKAYLARDDHHFYFERTSKSYLRLSLMKVQKVLIENHQIQHKGDIYFLTLDEIKTGLLESTDFQPIISERKELFNHQKKLFEPPVIGKEPSDDINQADENSSYIGKENNITLKGLSGLRKKVTGKIKIGMPAYLNEDSILVLPFTRCGELQPIINHVKGIIVEVGSPFEHLGILCRETGIPVLYNVKNAMNILKVGDEVQLDGFLGEVKIIKTI